ncbi:MAG: aldehyde dehydrogenase family protein [Microbacterium sp.]
MDQPPWNWPLISIWEIGPALRMGNTAVLKPSSNTPLSVLALASVINDVLPADVLVPAQAAAPSGTPRRAPRTSPR